jgi:hypothetical protein
MHEGGESEKDGVKRQVANHACEVMIRPNLSATGIAPASRLHRPLRGFRRKFYGEPQPECVDDPQHRRQLRVAGGTQRAIEALP